MIGTVTATDVDTDNALITFSVSGSELSITSSGVLTFGSAPDYETKSAYTATVTATDGTNSASQDITVTVTLVSDTADTETNADVLLLSGVSVPQNSTLEMFAGQKLVLQQTDAIKVLSSTASALDVTLSILDMENA